MDRRDFLELSAAGLLLSLPAGCSRPPREEVIPYARQPSSVTLGKAQWFATSCAIDGDSSGLLVETHEGRPTKIEGHSEHPASLGAASAWAQASLLGLYDANRARAVRHRSTPSTWEEFSLAVREKVTSKRGRGMHLVLAPTSSLSVARRLERLREALPELALHFTAAFGPERRLAASRLAFGRLLDAQYDFTRAEVVLSLGSDFLGVERGALRSARDFMQARGARRPGEAMNRLYVVEPALSLTGAKADHRLALEPSRIITFALAMVKNLAPERELPSVAELGERERAFVDAVVRDLRAHAGRSIVVAGEQQPPLVQALCHLCNEVLSNLGATTWFTRPTLVEPDACERGLGDFEQALVSGGVEALIISETNPVYDSGDEAIARRIESVPVSAYLGLYENEIARACRWMLPGRHYLESWGDGRSRDGTVSFVQPAILPLYGGRQLDEVLCLLSGDGPSSDLERLREFWSTQGLADDGAFREAIALGFLRGSALPRESVAFDVEAIELAAHELEPPRTGALELHTREDYAVHDGRFANNGWLQELPDPVTRQSWGNAALLAPETARRHSVKNGDRVALSAGAVHVEVVALVVPGQAEKAVTVAAGYGRSGEERVAAGIGANVRALLRTGEPVTLTRRGEGEPVLYQEADAASPEAVKVRSFAAYEKAPRRALPLAPELYHLKPTGAVQWAMSIDLTACTGCAACVIACQVENNVPVVGPEWVKRGRAMHWLRIDRYFGSNENDTVTFQPMLCQHCEKAPCEYVCPVNATTHSPDGLNEMTYNRCIGTRFCSNNCPYKVRRFNYLRYDDAPPVEKLARNPSVTVRARGVMEKCTYCVQRLRRSEIEAKVEGREFSGAGVQTACSATCPTGAIVFGSLTDASSPVKALRDHPLSYSVLEELGTKPRTTYLARLMNPNPSLAKEEG